MYNTTARKALRTQCHTLLYRARQRKGLRVFALGQRLRHFADHVATTAGTANGARGRRWLQDKESRLVCRPGRSPDAGDQYALGSGA